MNIQLGGVCSKCKKSGHNIRTCPLISVNVKKTLKIKQVKKTLKIKQVKKLSKLKITQVKQDCIITSKKFRFRKKIAAFDYDQTLVVPKKGSFSQNITDWTWIRDCVVEKIKEFYSKGFCIVIFTNQSRDFKKTQIENALNLLDVPYKAYIMYNKKLKKPNPYYFNEFIQGKVVNKNMSFYVGDALGRPGDFSDSDKNFAINSNIKYITPEEIFPFEKKTQIVLEDVKVQEMVIMIGYPGSGKSTYAKKNFTKSNYTILNGDILKTESKMIKELKKELSIGKSVVLDATFGTDYKKKGAPRPRQPFIKIAKENGVYIRAIHVNSSIELSMDRNRKRQKPIPKIVFYLYRKWFIPPSKKEGINEIIVI